MGMASGMSGLLLVFHPRNDSVVLVGAVSPCCFVPLYSLLCPVVIKTETRAYRLELYTMEATDWIVVHLLDDFILTP